MISAPLKSVYSIVECKFFLPTVSNPPPTPLSVLSMHPLHAYLLVEQELEVLHISSRQLSFREVKSTEIKFTLEGGSHETG